MCVGGVEEIAEEEVVVELGVCVSGWSELPTKVGEDVLGEDNEADKERRTMSRSGELCLVLLARTEVGSDVFSMKMLKPKNPK